MKIFYSMLVLFFCSQLCFGNDLVELNIKKESDSAHFVIGTDLPLRVEYIVDRKTMICLLYTGTNNYDSGQYFMIDCEKLKVYPTIKKYFETGQASK